MVTLFEAAVVGIGGIEGLAGGCVGVIGKKDLKFRPEGWPVVFYREQIFAAAVDDGLGDLDLGSDRVDGDKGSLQLQASEEQRDRDDLAGLVDHCLLTQH
jgi:hypothetical protein